MQEYLGKCEGCGQPIQFGEPFDMAVLKWSADFPGDKPGARTAFWHRACNPFANHTLDNAPFPRDYKKRDWEIDPPPYISDLDKMIAAEKMIVAEEDKMADDMDSRE